MVFISNPLRRQPGFIRRNLLEVLSATNPKAKQLQYNEAFNYSSYAREADKSGSIDALYK